MFPPRNRKAIRAVNSIVGSYNYRVASIAIAYDCYSEFYGCIESAKLELPLAISGSFMFVLIFKLLRGASRWLGCLNCLWAMPIFSHLTILDHSPMGGAQGNREKVT